MCRVLSEWLDEQHMTRRRLRTRRISWQLKKKENQRPSPSMRTEKFFSNTLVSPIWNGKTRDGRWSQCDHWGSNLSSHCLVCLSQDRMQGSEDIALLLLRCAASFFSFLLFFSFFFRVSWKLHLYQCPDWGDQSCDHQSLPRFQILHPLPLLTQNRCDRPLTIRPYHQTFKHHSRWSSNKELPRRLDLHRPFFWTWCSKQIISKNGNWSWPLNGQTVFDSETRSTRHDGNPALRIFELQC